jgi:hypothetical protein
MTFSATSRENTKRRPGIPLFMRDGWAWWFLVLFLALPSRLFAAEGTFQGKIVDPPGQKQVASGWIFVEGRNRMVRRVDVAHAVIVPPAGSSSGQGKKCGPECLAVGQEVRVTAEQDASGEWHARRVEILRPTSAKGYTIELTARPAAPSAALPRHAGAGGISPSGSTYETLPSQTLGCWITTPSWVCIQLLTEKSIIVRWSGGIMNDVL